MYRLQLQDRDAAEPDRRQILRRGRRCERARKRGEKRCGEEAHRSRIQGAPNGIRTRATALKGPRPGPLVDGGGAAQRRGTAGHDLPVTTKPPWMSVTVPR